MASQWYYKVMGEERGPVSASELRRLAREGGINEDTFVRKGLEHDWVLAERIKGLFDQPNPDIARQPTPAVTAASDRTDRSPPARVRRPLQHASASLPTPRRGGRKIRFLALTAIAGTIAACAILGIALVFLSRGSNRAAFDVADAASSTAANRGSAEAPSPSATSASRPASQEPNVPNATGGSAADMEVIERTANQLKNGLKVTGSASVSRGTYKLDLNLVNDTEWPVELSRTMVLLDSTEDGEACFGYGWHNEGESGMGTMGAPLNNWTKAGQLFGTIRPGESKRLNIWGEDTFIFQISSENRAYVTGALPELSIDRGATQMRFRPVVHFKRLPDAWVADAIDIVPMHPLNLAQIINTPRTAPTLRLLACLWLIEIDPSGARSVLEDAKAYLPKQRVVRGYIEHAFEEMKTSAVQPEAVASGKPSTVQPQSRTHLDALLGYAVVPLPTDICSPDTFPVLTGANIQTDARTFLQRAYYALHGVTVPNEATPRSGLSDDSAAADLAGKTGLSAGAIALSAATCGDDGDIARIFWAPKLAAVDGAVKGVRVVPASGSEWLTASAEDLGHRTGLAPEVITLAAAMSRNDIQLFMTSAYSALEGVTISLDGGRKVKATAADLSSKTGLTLQTTVLAAANSKDIRVFMARAYTAFHGTRVLDRDGKLAVVTAGDLARGTGLPVGTIVLAAALSENDSSTTFSERGTAFLQQAYSALHGVSLELGPRKSSVEATAADLSKKTGLSVATIVLAAALSEKSSKTFMARAYTAVDEATDLAEKTGATIAAIVLAAATCRDGDESKTGFMLRAYDAFNGVEIIAGEGGRHIKVAALDLSKKTGLDVGSIVLAAAMSPDPATKFMQRAYDATNKVKVYDTKLEPVQYSIKDLSPATGFTEARVFWCFIAGSGGCFIAGSPGKPSEPQLFVSIQLNSLP